MNEIFVEPLTQDAFAQFGDVLEAVGKPDKIINAGFCGRWHDRAALDFGADGRAGMSVFKAEPRALPYKLEMVERHPDGCQAFVPMSMDNWLVTVAEDEGGKPVRLRAFLAGPGQGVNYHRNTWHGVLTPLSAPGLFAVVDRIGETPNLEEFRLDPQYVVLEK
ncbi:ureidoglycolate lyase [Lentibacter algarum]|uniref:ureidoglycolate lyase n=1 Tax=Lentibacter algarum TaxID=576131 RepID=UPI001C0781AF|nr:ureidoglycolate lyase [Lentibacter algarum]MBU2980385.1 ureidoglycolate lyase [Lentibacter algarum]